MKVLIKIGLAGLVCITGSLAAQELEKRNGASFSVSHTFTDLGTREETSREIDGVTIVYPVDEEDVINLLLPKIAEFRKKRSILAPLEAKVIRETFATSETRTKVLNLVRSILGVETLSGDIDAIYDKALKDIDSLSDQWVQWSSDIETLHLFNHATVKPYRNGSTQVNFDQLHYLIKEKANTSSRFNLPLYLKESGSVRLIPSNGRFLPSLSIFSMSPPPGTQ